MKKSVFNEIEAVYPDIINKLPKEFDSHDFIRKFSHCYQNLYVSALATYNDNDSPFMIVHGEIARRLGTRTDLVRKIGVRNSEDIFKQVNGANVWRKL